MDKDTKKKTTKKTSTKKVTSSPVKSVEQQVKKEKPSISDEPVNILDISTKTKIGKFYKIEKVFLVFAVFYCSASVIRRSNLNRQHFKTRIGY